MSWKYARQWKPNVLFLQHLGGGCSAPIAAYARLEKGRLCMTGLVASPDGRRVVRVEGEAEDGRVLATRLAVRALDEGAQSILTEFRARTSSAGLAAQNGVLEGRRVVVTRARAEAEPLCERLAALGATPICAPAIRIEPVDDLRPLDDAIAGIASFDWVVFTSADAVEIFCRRWTHAGRTPGGPARRQGRRRGSRDGARARRMGCAARLRAGRVRRRRAGRRARDRSRSPRAPAARRDRKPWDGGDPRASRCYGGGAPHLSDRDGGDGPNGDRGHSPRRGRGALHERFDGTGTS